VRLHLFLPLACIFSLAACGDDGAPVRKEIAEAATAIKDYGFAKKDDLVVELKKGLAATKVELAELEAQAAAKTAEAREQLEPTLAKLREESAALEARIEDVKSATAEKWDETKERCSSTFADLQRSLSDAIDRLK
jgi:predicted  nucleic acid-binding Zn-ribbon protein